MEKQPVTLEDCCVEYWCEKAKKYMSRWTGRRDITKKLLKTALNPNQSIDFLYFIIFLRCPFWELMDRSVCLKHVYLSIRLGGEVVGRPPWVQEVLCSIPGRFIPKTLLRKGVLRQSLKGVLPHAFRSAIDVSAVENIKWHPLWPYSHTLYLK